MSRIQSLAVAVLVAMSASCATTPYSGEYVSSNTVSVGGLVDAPGNYVYVEGYDWNAGRYISVGGGTSKTSPTVAAGVICPNSPALYGYSASAKLNWPFFWRWVSSTSPRYKAKLRATQRTGAGENRLLFSDNPEAMNCMAKNAFNSTCDFYNVAANICGFLLTEAAIYSNEAAPWNPAGQ